MKERRIVSLKKKLVWLTVCFSALHIYLALIANAVLRITFLEYTDDLYVDGADFSPIANFVVMIWNAVFVFFGALISIALNTVVFVIFILIFNKTYYLSVTDESEAFVFYSKRIMLTLMGAGSALLLLINYKMFPGSIIAVFMDYFLFSFIAYIITKRKTNKIYLRDSKHAPSEEADASP
jgi:hypothetical protein